MKNIAILLLFALIFPAKAGEAVDKGTSETVPDWAVGPLLVVPIGKIDDVDKDDCVRLGTLQAKSLELFGRKFKLATIGLSEIPNSSKVCLITTEKEAGGQYELHLSQSLSNQTYYHVMITWIPSDGSKPVAQSQFDVWDVKSRKSKNQK